MREETLRAANLALIGYHQRFAAGRDLLGGNSVLERRAAVPHTRQVDHHQSSTDTEALFYLALTFGLVDDPFDGVARAVGFVEDVGHANKVEHPVQMTVATTNGEFLWVFRYSSERQTRSLFFSTELSQLRALHPEIEVLRELGGETRFVVSEPLRDLEGAWNEVPESSAAVVGPGTAEIRAFAPISPV